MRTVAGYRRRSLLAADAFAAKENAPSLKDANGVDCVFGLPGSKPLSRAVGENSDEIRAERALTQSACVLGFAEVRHKARSWDEARRAVARIEATPLGFDVRFVVTNIEGGSPEWVYETLYGARGQMETLIKPHKAQLSSDRTSCRSAVANQVRLVPPRHY